MLHFHELLRQAASAPGSAPGQATSDLAIDRGWTAARDGLALTPETGEPVEALACALWNEGKRDEALAILERQIALEKKRRARARLLAPENRAGALTTAAIPALVSAGSAPTPVAVSPAAPGAAPVQAPAKRAPDRPALAVSAARAPAVVHAVVERFAWSRVGQAAGLAAGLVLLFIVGLGAKVVRDAPDEALAFSEAPAILLAEAAAATGPVPAAAAPPLEAVDAPAKIREAAAEAPAEPPAIAEGEADAAAPTDTGTPPDEMAEAAPADPSPLAAVAENTVPIETSEVTQAAAAAPAAIVPIPPAARADTVPLAKRQAEAAASEEAKTRPAVRAKKGVKSERRAARRAAAKAVAARRRASAEREPQVVFRREPSRFRIIGRVEDRPRVFRRARRDRDDGPRILLNGRGIPLLRE